ncbi:zf-HC2 domain-containing protein [Noviherbaspirillum cavernae]|uniref:Zf-HC2 domain-containing protein n=1 Tax=Noviherbaspirillum cavernae TaxID=2320862 RepID=A0A418WXF5_9BURK|nr:zf-HC2 domain-containing protein [Noviherbaspirillum cavernae]RJG04881.1 zf-HC2 domain-containing protein [Noviherbaspirillum cavernae]
MGLKPTCREIHQLTSEGLDRELSMVERARVRVHLLVCDGCSAFHAQMQLLRRAMRQMQISKPDDKEGGQS